jgi:hypothetical protein
MGNLRDLKAFVRYDGSGRVVAGSLIFRKKKPTIGNFQQIQAFKCCNFNQTQIVVAITSSFPIASADFVVYGDTGDNMFMYDYTSLPAANVVELANILNIHSSQFGWFSVNDAGDQVLLQINAATAAFFDAAGATSIQASAFED